MSRQHPVVHVHLRGKQKLTLFDIINVAFFAYPLSGLPQVIGVLGGNIEGVSVLSWGGFMLFSSLFFVYGVKHRVIPMIITNGLWVLVDSVTVVAVLIKR